MQIFDFNFLVLVLNETRQRAAQRMRTQHGLLTNDSLIAAAAAEYRISCLASRDSDFDGVSGLTLYTPTDLP